jgi:hypothetical protein
VKEVAEADRSGVPVAAHPDVDQLAVGEVRADDHGRHSPVHAVEAVGAVEKVRRRFAGAADTAHLGDVVRFDAVFVKGLDDGAGDGVVSAAGAKRRFGTLVGLELEVEPIDRAGLARRIGGRGVGGAVAGGR